IVIIGICRVFFGLKGWEFYVFNWVFWAKMMAFIIVGLLSIIPTVRFISWSRQASGNPSFSVPAAELASVKNYVRAEGFIFLLIPVFATVIRIEPRKSRDRAATGIRQRTVVRCRHPAIHHPTQIFSIHLAGDL
ncbi:MAG: DUF2214 family protein, partial [Mesorhizobium sp.]